MDKESCAVFANDDWLLNQRFQDLNTAHNNIFLSQSTSKPDSLNNSQMFDFSAKKKMEFKCPEADNQVCQKYQFN